MVESKLLAPLFSDPEVAEQLSDVQFISYMLQVEAALARVQETLGIIPHGTAQQLADGISNFLLDMDRLQTAIDADGIPTVDLIMQLREQVGGEAASYVHWGATSQDIMDTALVLQLRSALTLLEHRLNTLIGNLARLADAHRATLMAGRTHGQHALPLTFGLKVAGWLAPLLRHRERLDQLKPRLLVVQFGGAVGTIASLGDQGMAVQEALAQELGLGVPLMPWHSQRDTLAEFAGWLSLVSGSLAKMAQDIILLAQSEVAEVRESGDSSRGSSSTMPQKRNPVISQAILAAAHTNAALLSSMHGALVHEHERATSAWQVEWLTLPQMVILTAAVLNKALFLSENLVVDADRMQANLAGSNGLLMAEAIDLALSPIIGRTEAKQIIRAAVPVAVEQNRHLVDVVRERVRERVDADIDWERLLSEANYLGSSDAFINRVLQQAESSEHD